MKPVAGGRCRTATQRKAARLTVWTLRGPRNEVLKVGDTFTDLKGQTFTLDAIEFPTRKFPSGSMSVRQGDYACQVWPSYFNALFVKE